MGSEVSLPVCEEGERNAPLLKKKTLIFIFIYYILRIISKIIFRASLTSDSLQEKVKSDHMEQT